MGQLFQLIKTMENERINHVQKMIDATTSVSKEELGLDSLVFKNQTLYISYLDSKNLIKNVKIINSNAYVDNLIREDSRLREAHYERINFPIIFIEGDLVNINGETQGSIKGVVRPKLLTKVGPNITRPVKGEMPELHFYLHEAGKGYFEGKSLYRYSHSSTEGIGCGIKLCDRQALKQIDNDFEINQEFSDICNIFNYK